MNGAYPDVEDVDVEQVIIEASAMFEAFKIGNDDEAIRLAKKIAQDVTGGILP